MGGQFKINWTICYYGPGGVEFHSPTGGFWGGDGWSDNKRGTPEDQINWNGPVAINGLNKDSQIDQACKDHDKRYHDALPYQTSDPAYYRELISRADLQLIKDIFSVPLSEMDYDEFVYQQSVYRAFLAKLVLDGSAEIMAELTAFLAEHGLTLGEGSLYGPFETSPASGT